MRDLCVAIVSEGNAPRVCAALEGALAHAGWLDLEAVVFDAGDGSVAEHVEHRFRGVRTVRCPGRELGDACNRAVQDARANYVLFLDPNLVIRKGTLAHLVATLDRRPDVAVAGARQLDEDGELFPSIRRFPSARHMLAEALGVDRLPGTRRLLGERELDRRRYERESDCELTLGFLLARRTALASVGWLDGRFSGFARDADLCARLSAQGWRVIHSPAVTALRRRPGRAQSERLEAQVARARLRFAEKHIPQTAGRYRHALALRYLLRIGVYAFAGDYDRRRRRAARAALAATVRGGAAPEQPLSLRP